MPSRFERMIESSGCLPKHLRSVLAGTARSTRLAFDMPDERSAVVTEVASGFLSPLTVTFVWWVLQESRHAGVSRLYFLARDGYILKNVAEILNKAWQLGMDIRYLHCSRESLMLPSYSKTGEFELHWMTWGYLSSITLEEILVRLNLTYEDIRNCSGYSQIVSDAACANVPLTHDGLARVCAFLQDIDVEQLICRKNSDRYETAVNYLRQEGLFDGSEFALVDTGWRGTSQHAISLIMSRAGYRPSGGVRGYYLGLNAGTAVYGNDILKAFLFDWNHKLRDYRLYNFICFEMLFSSGEGRTIGYSNFDGMIVPQVSAPSAGERQFAWAVEILHRCVRCYASSIVRVLKFDDYDARFSSLDVKLSRTFISNPTEREAQVFGEFQIASEMRERDMQRIAPPITLYELFQVALGRARISGFWPQGSMARSRLRSVMLAYRTFLDFKLLEIARKYFLKY